MKTKRKSGTPKGKQLHQSQNYIPVHSIISPDIMDIGSSMKIHVSQLQFYIIVEF